MKGVFYMLYKIETAKTTYYIRQQPLSQRYIIVGETVHNYMPLVISGYRYPRTAEKHLREIQKALFACGELDYIPGTTTKMYSCTADLKWLQQNDKFTDCNPREFVKKWYV